jgi:hypothetical protein
MIVFLWQVLSFILGIIDFTDFFNHASPNMFPMSKNVQSYSYDVNKPLNKQVFPKDQKLGKDYKSENLKQHHKFIKPNNSIWKKVEKIIKWIVKISGWIYKISLVFSIFEFLHQILLSIIDR